MRSLIFLLLLSFNATAALYDRGNGLIYDDVLDITWLADANYAFTIGVTNFGLGDGRMTWTEGNSWVDSLLIGGHSLWRLPTTSLPDESCNNQEQYFGGNCTGSEMGHLFYETLENTYWSGSINTGPFINIQINDSTSDHYWSSTEYEQNNIYAYDFSFATGSQRYRASKNYNDYIWPVHDGDIGNPVPIPAAFWLFASGLISLRLFKR